MELWIRSQDKTTLIRSYEIYIAEHSNSYVIRAKRTSHILGAYKTIERALEVLDEINIIKWWKYMASLDFVVFITTLENKYNEEEKQEIFKLMNTYQMPEE